MRKIATAAVLAALMAAPASAQAAPALSPAETVAVTSGVLTFTTLSGQVDDVVLSDGLLGMHVLSETSSPALGFGTGCGEMSGYPSAMCFGATSATIATGDLDDSVRVLSDLPATVDAGAGADEVTGGDGDDTLDGGGGADVIGGGAGDDRIEARDGLVDTIDCGEGDDRATADPVDVVTNCETDALPVVLPKVPEVPVPGAPGVPAEDETPKPPKADDPRSEAAPPRAIRTPLPAVAPVVALAAAVVRVGADGVARLELGCPAEEAAGCSGHVFLDPAPTRTRTGKAAKGGRKAKVRALAARRGRFGRSPFQIAAGKRRSVSVRLSPLARKRLGLPSAKKARAARRGRRIRATVTVVQRGKAATRSVVELRG